MIWIWNPLLFLSVVWCIQSMDLEYVTRGGGIEISNLSGLAGGGYEIQGV